jgi:hypothetical protein
MRRQLQTSHQRVRETAGTLPTEKTRRAYLVAPYKDKVQSVMVQFSDPRLSTVGTITRARVSPGLAGLDTAAPQLDVGYPVTVVIRRGQVEVVGF